MIHLSSYTESLIGELPILVEQTGLDSCINSDVISVEKYVKNPLTNKLVTADLTLGLLSSLLALLAVHRLICSDHFVILFTIIVLSGRFHSIHGMQLNEYPSIY